MEQKIKVKIPAQRTVQQKALMTASAGNQCDYSDIDFQHFQQFSSNLRGSKGQMAQNAIRVHEKQLNSQLKQQSEDRSRADGASPMTNRSSALE